MRWQRTSPAAPPYASHTDLLLVYLDARPPQCALLEGPALGLQRTVCNVCEHLVCQAVTFRDTRTQIKRDYTYGMLVSC